MSTKQLDAVAALRKALSVLSRAEIERAWAIAEAANEQVKHGSAALRAEVAAHLLASVLTELASTTTQPDDLGDILPVGEALLIYLLGRVAVIVAESGRR